MPKVAINLLHTRKCTIAQAWANDIILITSIIVRGARQDDTKTTINYVKKLVTHIAEESILQ